jgi:hypothetical protein
MYCLFRLTKEQQRVIAKIKRNNYCDKCGNQLIKAKYGGKKMIEIREKASSLQEKGFYSEDELLKWVYKADLSTPKKLALFKAWQEHDGTKEMLVRLIRTECL